MKVVTSVKLLCGECYKVKVPKTRDKSYYYVFCNANPRHKQRTKWPRNLMGLAERGSEGSAQGEGEAHFETCGHSRPHIYPVSASSFLSKLTLGGLQQTQTSSLLASRMPGCSMGELHWRTALQDPSSR